MSISFVSATTTSGTGSTISIARPPGIQEGDLLVLWFVVSADASIPGMPDKWMSRWWTPSVGTTFRVGGFLKWAEEVEENTYDFTLGASLGYVAALVAYRGVFRSFTIDPGSYPWGLFKRSVTIDTDENAIQGSASTTLNIVTGDVPHTGLPYCRSMLVFAQEGTNPKLEDPSPLVPIRAIVQTTTLALMVADAEYIEAQAVIPDVIVKSTHNGVWVTIGDPMEPVVAAAVDMDNYKAKLLRQSMPPPYDTRLESNLGLLLTVIGTSDNEIGGLYGDDDFLSNDNVVEEM